MTFALPPPGPFHFQSRLPDTSVSLFNFFSLSLGAFPRCGLSFLLWSLFVVNHARIVPRGVGSVSSLPSSLVFPCGYLRLLPS